MSDHAKATPRETPRGIPRERRGAIVLCGGLSTRMGLPKATLPFGTETMLARVVRLVGEVAPQIIVVAATEQELPPLPLPVIVARDRQSNRGPLEGLAAGLAALPESVDAAYATSCDVPLLVPLVVDRLFELLGEHEIVVPREQRFFHPLAAVYRRRVLPHVEQLLQDGKLRPAFLFERVATLEAAVETLRPLDPELATFANLNSPADYLQALERAGLTPAAEIVAHFNRQARP